MTFSETEEVSVTEEQFPDMHQGPKVKGQATEKENHMELGVEKSLHHYIGMSQETLVKSFGEPMRKDPSAFDYDWWIYHSNGKYSQFGVWEGKIVTIYALGEQLNVSPFKIGQPLEEIKEVLDKSRFQTITVQGNKYEFQFTEHDKQVTPMIKVGKNSYAQIYVDSFTKTISSIRYLDGETLIKQRPFDLVYFGELINATEDLTKEKIERIREGETKQIFDITNIIRTRHQLERVEWDQKTAAIALSHSKEMDTLNYFSHTSPEKGELGDRLQHGKVFYKIAGENIAAKYIDAPAVVEGWLNSEGHRKTLLNKDFSHLGVGVFNNYYTQNFIKKWE